MPSIHPYGSPYKLTNLVGNVTIFSIPSLEIRFGIGLTSASIGDYSKILFSLPIDFNYYLPFTISNFRFALNLHPQQTLGIPTYTGSNDEVDNTTDFINVGLYAFGGKTCFVGVVSNVNLTINALNFFYCFCLLVNFFCKC